MHDIAWQGVSHVASCAKMSYAAKQKISMWVAMALERRMVTQGGSHAYSQNCAGAIGFKL